MPNGKIFGTSDSVAKLADVLQLCVSTLEMLNEKGKILLTKIEGAKSDPVYVEAEEIVNEVTSIINTCPEPLENTSKQLKAYAEFLERHGK